MASGTGLDIKILNFEDFYEEENEVIYYDCIEDIEIDDDEGYDDLKLDDLDEPRMAYPTIELSDPVMDLMREEYPGLITDLFFTDDIDVKNLQYHWFQLIHKVRHDIIAYTINHICGISMKELRVWKVLKQGALKTLVGEAGYKAIDHKTGYQLTRLSSSQTPDIFDLTSKMENYFKVLDHGPNAITVGDYSFAGDVKERETVKRGTYACLINSLAVHNLEVNSIWLIFSSHDQAHNESIIDQKIRPEHTEHLKKLVSAVILRYKIIVRKLEEHFGRDLTLSHLYPSRKSSIVEFNDHRGVLKQKLKEFCKLKEQDKFVFSCQEDIEKFVDCDYGADTNLIFKENFDSEDMKLLFDMSTEKFRQFSAENNFSLFLERPLARLTVGDYLFEHESKQKYEEYLKIYQKSHSDFNGRTYRHSNSSKMPLINLSKWRSKMFESFTMDDMETLVGKILDDSYISETPSLPEVVAFNEILTELRSSLKDDLETFLRFQPRHYPVDWENLAEDPLKEAYNMGFCGNLEGISSKRIFDMFLHNFNVDRVSFDKLDAIQKEEIRKRRKCNKKYTFDTKKRLTAEASRTLAEMGLGLKKLKKTTQVESKSGMCLDPDYNTHDLELYLKKVSSTPSDINLDELSPEKIFHKKSEYNVSTGDFTEVMKAFLGREAGHIAYSVQQLCRSLTIMSSRDRDQEEVTFNILDEDIIVMMFGACLSSSEDNSSYFSIIIPIKKIAKGSEVVFDSWYKDGEYAYSRLLYFSNYEIGQYYRLFDNYVSTMTTVLPSLVKNFKMDRSSVELGVRNSDASGFILITYLAFNRTISTMLINSRFVFMKGTGSNQDHYDFIIDKYDVILRKPFGSLVLQRILQFSHFCCKNDSSAINYNKMRIRSSAEVARRKEEKDRVLREVIEEYDRKLYASYTKSSKEKRRWSDTDSEDDVFDPAYRVEEDKRVLDIERQFEIEENLGLQQEAEQSDVDEDDADELMFADKSNLEYNTNLLNEDELDEEDKVNELFRQNRYKSGLLKRKSIFFRREPLEREYSTVSSCLNAEISKLSAVMLWTNYLGILCEIYLGVLFNKDVGVKGKDEFDIFEKTQKENLKFRENKEKSPWFLSIFRYCKDFTIRYLPKGSSFVSLKQHAKNLYLNGKSYQSEVSHLMLALGGRMLKRHIDSEKGEGTFLSCCTNNKALTKTLDTMATYKSSSMPIDKNLRIDVSKGEKACSEAISKTNRKSKVIFNLISSVLKVSIGQQYEEKVKFLQGSPLKAEVTEEQYERLKELLENVESDESKSLMPAEDREELLNDLKENPIEFLSADEDGILVRSSMQVIQTVLSEKTLTADRMKELIEMKAKLTNSDLTLGEKDSILSYNMNCLRSIRGLRSFILIAGAESQKFDFNLLHETLKRFLTDDFSNDIKAKESVLEKLILKQITLLQEAFDATFKGVLNSLLKGYNENCKTENILTEANKLDKNLRPIYEKIVMNAHSNAHKSVRGCAEVLLILLQSLILKRVSKMKLICFSDLGSDTKTLKTQEKIQQLTEELRVQVNLLGSSELSIKEAARKKKREVFEERSYLQSQLSDHQKSISKLIVARSVLESISTFIMGHGYFSGRNKNSTTITDYLKFPVILAKAVEKDNFKSDLTDKILSRVKQDGGSMGLQELSLTRKERKESDRVLKEMAQLHAALKNISADRLRIDRHINDLIKLMPEELELHISLFKKKQHGGVREILILNIFGRLMIFTTEQISKEICLQNNDDALAAGDVKYFRIANDMKEITEWVKRKEVDEYGFMRTFSADCKTWCQMKIVIWYSLMFACIASTCPLLYATMQLSFIIGTFKFIQYSKEYLRILVKQEIDRIRPDREKDKSQKPIPKTKLDFFQNTIKQGGETFFVCLDGMGQGIQHYSSSLEHQICMLILKSHVKSTNYILHVVNQEIFTTETFKMCCKVTSDDVGLILGVKFKVTSFGCKNGSRINYKVINCGNWLVRYFRNMWRGCCALLFIVLSIKSAENFDALEFNSAWKAETCSLPATLKFSRVATDFPNMDCPKRAIDELEGRTKALSDNGAKAEQVAIISYMNELFIENFYRTAPSQASDPNHILHMVADEMTESESAKIRSLTFEEKDFVKLVHSGSMNFDLLPYELAIYPRFNRALSTLHSCNLQTFSAVKSLETDSTSPGEPFLIKSAYSKLYSLSLLQELDESQIGKIDMSSGEGLSSKIYPEFSIRASKIYLKKKKDLQSLGLTYESFREFMNEYPQEIIAAPTSSEGVLMNMLKTFFSKATIDSMRVLTDAFVLSRVNALSDVTSMRFSGISILDTEEFMSGGNLINEKNRDFSRGLFSQKEMMKFYFTGDKVSFNKDEKVVHLPIPSASSVVKDEGLYSVLLIQPPFVPRDKIKRNVKNDYLSLRSKADPKVCKNNVSELILYYWFGVAPVKPFTTKSALRDELLIRNVFPHFRLSFKETLVQMEVVTGSKTLSLKITIAMSIIHKMARKNLTIRGYFEGHNTDNYLSTIFVLRRYNEFVSNFAVSERPNILDKGLDSKERAHAISTVAWNIIDFDTEKEEIDICKVLEQIKVVVPTVMQGLNTTCTWPAINYINNCMDLSQPLSQLDIRTRYLLFKVRLENQKIKREEDITKLALNLFPEINEPMVVLRKEQVYSKSERKWVGDMDFACVSSKVCVRLQYNQGTDEHQITSHGSENLVEVMEGVAQCVKYYKGISGNLDTSLLFNILNNMKMVGSQNIYCLGQDKKIMLTYQQPAQGFLYRVVKLNIIKEKLLDDLGVRALTYNNLRIRRGRNEEIEFYTKIKRSNDFYLSIFLDIDFEKGEGDSATGEGKPDLKFLKLRKIKPSKLETDEDDGQELGRGLNLPEEVAEEEPKHLFEDDPVISDVESDQDTYMSSNYEVEDDQSDEAHTYVLSKFKRTFVKLKDYSMILVEPKLGLIKKPLYGLNEEFYWKNKVWMSQGTSLPWNPKDVLGLPVSTMKTILKCRKKRDFFADRKINVTTDGETASIEYKDRDPITSLPIDDEANKMPEMSMFNMDVFLSEPLDFDPGKKKQRSPLSIPTYSESKDSLKVQLSSERRRSPLSISSYIANLKLELLEMRRDLLEPAIEVLNDGFLTGMLPMDRDPQLSVITGYISRCVGEKESKVQETTTQALSMFHTYCTMCSALRDTSPLMMEEYLDYLLTCDFSASCKFGEDFLQSDNSPIKHSFVEKTMTHIMIVLYMGKVNRHLHNCYCYDGNRIIDSLSPNPRASSLSKDKILSDAVEVCKDGLYKKETERWVDQKRSFREVKANDPYYQMKDVMNLMNYYMSKSMSPGKYWNSQKKTTFLAKLREDLKSYKDILLIFSTGRNFSTSTKKKSVRLANLDIMNDFYKTRAGRDEADQRGYTRNRNGSYSLSDYRKLKMDSFEKLIFFMSENQETFLSTRNAFADHLKFVTREFTKVANQYLSCDILKDIKRLKRPIYECFSNDVNFSEIDFMEISEKNPTTLLWINPFFTPSCYSLIDKRMRDIEDSGLDYIIVGRFTHLKRLSVTEGNPKVIFNSKRHLSSVNRLTSLKRSVEIDEQRRRKEEAKNWKPAFESQIYRFTEAVELNCRVREQIQWSITDENNDVQTFSIGDDESAYGNNFNRVPLMISVRDLNYFKEIRGCVSAACTPATTTNEVSFDVLRSSMQLGVRGVDSNPYIMFLNPTSKIVEKHVLNEEKELMEYSVILKNYKRDLDDENRERAEVFQTAIQERREEIQSLEPGNLLAQLKSMFKVNINDMGLEEGLSEGEIKTFDDEDVSLNIVLEVRRELESKQMLKRLGLLSTIDSGALLHYIHKNGMVLKISDLASCFAKICALVTDYEEQCFLNLRDSDFLNCTHFINSLLLQYSALNEDRLEEFNTELDDLLKDMIYEDIFSSPYTSSCHALEVLDQFAVNVKLGRHTIDLCSMAPNCYIRQDNGFITSVHSGPERYDTVLNLLCQVGPDAHMYFSEEFCTNGSLTFDSWIKNKVREDELEDAETLGVSQNTGALGFFFMDENTTLQDSAMDIDAEYDEL